MTLNKRISLLMQAEKEKFDDDMIILGKAFPYALTPFH